MLSPLHLGGGILTHMNTQLQESGLTQSCLSSLSINTHFERTNRTTFPQYKLICEESKKALPPLKVEDQLMTVTQLTELLEEVTNQKISAIALNKILAEKNLQYRNTTDNPRWLPTDLGKEHGMVVLETAKGRDKTVQVLKWYKTVLDLLASI